MMGKMDESEQRRLMPFLERIRDASNEAISGSGAVVAEIERAREETGYAVTIEMVVVQMGIQRLEPAPPKATREPKPLITSDGKIKKGVFTLQDKKLLGAAWIADPDDPPDPDV